MTKLQAIMLTRLSLEFGVDVEPAKHLEPSALDRWINDAEEQLLADLMAEQKRDASSRRNQHR